MDKNTITGIVLIGLLLFGFTFYQNKQYQKQAAYQAQLDSIALVCAPNSSIASTSDATTQLLAPQNTPANPRAAPKPAGMPSSGAATQPKVAPTKKLGTTSPPLKPELRVRAVSRILIH